MTRISPMFQICEYDNEFLNCSWNWLTDKEIKELTMTADFTQEQQKAFFESLPDRVDYKIFGIRIGGKPVGACGLKNIFNDGAEYWGYIGEKQFWGKGYGGKIIDEMIAAAKALNMSYLYLRVSKTNHRAIHLYSKKGFISSHELSTVDVLHMHLNLL